MARQPASDRPQLGCYNVGRLNWAISNQGIVINRTYLTDFLRHNAEKHADKPAIIFGNQSISYGELRQRVEAAAAVLSEQLGGRRQQVVAILAPNSLEFVIAYLAVVQAGQIALPMDITFKKLEIDSVLSAVRPALVLARRDFSRLAGDKFLLIEDVLAAKPQSRPDKRPGIAPDRQIATLFLSSGTTGRPKAIPNTHANILWDIESIARPMDWRENDSLLITLHLSHRHGLVICLLGGLYHGNTVYLEERFSPERTLKSLSSGKVSIYSAVPSIYESLVEYEPDGKIDISKVRLFASSSSPLPPFLREAFERRFGKVILDRYGTSETGSIAIKSKSEESFDSILDGVKLRLEPNGEIAIKSPGLFPGYFHNPAATRRGTTPDGWWLIGDIGEMKNGSLKLKGRSKERIVKSGYSIYPQDIEWALRQGRLIEEVRVVGLHSAGRIDDKIVCFYVGGASRDGLEEYSKANLPRSWRPDEFIRLSRLPKGHTNKVQIGKLKEIAESKFA